MKTKLLNIFTFAALGCSSLTSLADTNYQYNVSSSNQKHSDESSKMSNIMSDAKITISIKRQFLADDRISGLNIRVTTINGSVTLVGTVPSEEEKQLAISIAKATKGVRHVDSDLEITDAGLIRKASSDAMITSRVKVAFLDDSEINFLDISVKTINGKVTLKGSVPDEKTKRKAISLAKEIRQVKDVISHLEINKASSLKNLASDSAITSIIKLRYFEDEELNGLDIHVKTINKEVTISGVVFNKAAEQRAISIAKLTNGVEKVISQLKVQRQ